MGEPLLTLEERTAWLTCPMDDNESGADTVGGFLVRLLHELWRHEEGFSSKRPFGNSGWKYDVWITLRKADLVGDDLVRISAYPVDEDQPEAGQYVELDWSDDRALDARMLECIDLLAVLDSLPEPRKPQPWPNRRGRKW